MAAAPTRAFRRRLIAITLLAASVRVSYILIAKQGDDACGQPLCGDAIWYSAQAQAIADGAFFEDPFGRGGPAADHPPLTPLVLAPVSFVFPDSVLAQRLAIAAIGTGAVALVMLLGRRVGGERVGSVAGVLAALYPNLWLNDGVVMSEALAAAGTAALLLLVLAYGRAPGVRSAAVLGLAGGVAVLARAELALLLPLSLLPVALAAPRGRREKRLVAVRDVAVAGAVTAAVLVPWVLFNVARFEEPVTISTNDGLTLIGANCDKVYGGGSIGIWVVPAAEAYGDPMCAPEVVRPEGDQSVVSATYRDAALDYIGNHTRDLPKVLLARQGRVWSAYETHQMWWYNQGEGRERTLSRIGEYAYKVLVPLAAVGAWSLRRRRRVLWPLLATFVVVAATATLFYGLVRFRVPAEIALVVLAAQGGVRLWERWRPTPLATDDAVEPSTT